MTKDTMNNFFRNNPEQNKLSKKNDNSTARNLSGIEIQSLTAVTGDIVVSRTYNDYYDIANTIAVAGASNPNDFDSTVYNRETIAINKGRIAERILVKNDGTDTLFLVISHTGGLSFSAEVPLYKGESKIYYNVHEIRLRSPTVGNAYRVMEYELNPTSISVTDIDTLVQQSVTKVSMMEFWSALDDIITLTTATTNVNLPDITIADIPANTTILRVVGMFKCRAFNNTSVAVNAINTAAVINIKKSTGAWAVDDVALINIADNIWSTAASTKEGGMLIEGTNDAASEVDANATYNLRFNGNVFVDGNNFELIDVLVGLKVYFIAT